MGDSDDLINQMDKYKELFYQKNKKNTFFTKNQKLNCALSTSNQFSIDELLKISIFIEENTNKIHIKYPLLKNFLHPNNYEQVTNHMFNLTEQLIHSVNNYEIHADLKSFSITAAQRYHDLITYFLQKYFSNDSDDNHITKAYLYNAPNIIQILQKMFFSLISQQSKEKIVIV